MNISEIVIVIILVIPTILILFFWKKQLEQDELLSLSMNKKENSIEQLKITLPLQITAYERLIVMLERLKPTGLVMRINKPGFNSVKMQLELLGAIRSEFEHNVSMQMYVSDIAWELVVKAKEETVAIVKKAAMSNGVHESVIKLNTEIFRLEQETENKLINLAINNLKKEVRKLY